MEVNIKSNVNNDIVIMNMFPPRSNNPKIKQCLFPSTGDLGVMNIDIPGYNVRQEYRKHIK